MCPFAQPREGKIPHPFFQKMGHSFLKVREIVETVIKDPLLEVRFRMSTDTDEVIRIAEFDLQEIEDYGYNVITEDFDLFDFDDDEWEDGEVEMDDDESLEIDEDELISFMNEFFLINDHVPPAEMF